MLAGPAKTMAVDPGTPGLPATPNAFTKCVQGDNVRCGLGCASLSLSLGYASQAVALGFPTLERFVLLVLEIIRRHRVTLPVNRVDVVACTGTDICDKFEVAKKEFKSPLCPD